MFDDMLDKKLGMFFYKNKFLIQNVERKCVPAMKLEEIFNQKIYVKLHNYETCENHMNYGDLRCLLCEDCFYNFS